MATSMKTARIGLSFDKSGLENSWFLVDFSKHSRIEDVSNEIMDDYFNDMTYCEQKVILRINNFLLPPSASSELFRENDIVTVRLESRGQDKTSVHEAEGIQNVSGKWPHASSDVNSRQNHSSLSQVEVEESCRHKRKRTHSESGSRERHKSLKHKKKTKKGNVSEEDLESIQTESTKNNEAKEKSKGKGNGTRSTDKIECSASTSYERINNREDRNDETNDDKLDHQKIVKLKKKSTKDDADKEADILGELKQDTVVEVEESVTDIASVNGDASSLSSTGKRKRCRRRKRHKRTDSAKEEISNADDDSRNFGLNGNCDTYKGREVDKNERRLYGNLPDKLEPPKYYRHGYRNLNTYAIEPNKHIKFDEGSKPEKMEESTKQYNFLCKSRKITDEGVNEVKNESETVLDSQDAIPETDAHVVESLSVHNDSKAFQDENKTEDNCEQEQLSSQNESFTAMPFNYDDSSLDTNFDNTWNKSVAMETSPVSLERKTLSNGVSVFVRKRSSQSSPFRGFSKQEQLDTKMTNVSTVFVNPPIEKEFKVPSSPAARPKLLPKQCSPEVNGSLTGTGNLHGDFSQSMPLVGTPNTGDIIAYKILEISSTCTPEVSGYKIAKVLSVDDKQMLELKNLHQSDDQEKQITKFHVEIEDDNEILTNTENLSDVVTLHLSSLLEPKKVSSA